MTTTTRASDPARRRNGTLLIAWGLAGLVLNGLIGAGAAMVAVNGIDGFQHVGDAVDEIVTIVDSTREALVSGSVSIADIAVTLDEASAVLETAAGVAEDLGSTIGTIGTVAGGFEILGQKPFGLIAEPAATAAVSLGDLATSLGGVEDALSTNSTDLGDLAVRIGTVATSLEASRDRLARIDVRLGPATSVAAIVVLCIVAWLAIAAIAAIAVGRRWRQEGARDA